MAEYEARLTHAYHAPVLPFVDYDLLNQTMSSTEATILIRGVGDREAMASPLFLSHE